MGSKGAKEAGRFMNREPPLCLFRHYHTIGKGSFVLNTAFIPNGLPRLCAPLLGNQSKRPFFKKMSAVPPTYGWVPHSAHFVLSFVVFCCVVWSVGCAQATQWPHGNYVVESFEYLIADAR